MGTGDFQIAKLRLLEWYYERHKMPSAYSHPSTVPLAEVLLDYWTHHGSKLNSSDTVKILLRRWSDYWGEAAVGDLRDINKQEAFHEHLRDACGYAPRSINRVLEIGRAAIRRAWKRGVLESVPFIATVKARSDKPMGRPLSVKELRAYYRGSEYQHWHDFVLLMVGTGARPGAIIEMEKAQIDFEAKLIYLNPEGREQTNKHRATVRLLPTLETRFKNRPDGRLLVFRDNTTITTMNIIIRRSRERAGLDNRVNAYSFRHTVARYLRSQGVDTAEIAAQLGHHKFGYDMTLRYMPHAPDYLAKSAEALDRLLVQIIEPDLSQKDEIISEKTR